MQIESSQIANKQAVTVPQTTPDTELVINMKPPLPPGPHVFELVVVDDLGFRSAPVTWTVEVRAQPTAVINGPKAVAGGQAISLTAKGSAAAAPGTLSSLIWTQLS